MPYFRINGVMVHLKLGGPKHKQPKPCVAKIEIDGRACHCMAIGRFQCDAPMEDEAHTCDAPLCDEHAAEVGPDRHLCPTHRAEFQSREVDA